ncbi:hypothetical protein [Hyphomicrobium sp. D-2]|uniref:hypothetical protein n=1 Tax=Hyphomicrobium sp. D-2 TaxID=3041621 RepID=UPI00245722F7|nr:hypothetical protein [Hyphomicrobium sp. D-2]MDH4983264.1 hypothetical protein [Hyphomicrobium sp. D-2]
MAIGTILGAAASAGISYGANKLFGGNSSKNANAALMNAPALVSQSQIDDSLSMLGNPQFTGFNGGGLASHRVGDRVEVASSSSRQDLIGRLSGMFPQAAGQLAELRSRLDPTTGQLKQAAMSEIDNARARAIGNLRENLQRRRLLGSSFAQDAISRGEAEFAQQKARSSAEIDLLAIDSAQKLIMQETELSAQGFNTLLSELNLQAGMAAELSNKFQTEANANARMLAQVVAHMATGSASNAAANARENAKLAAEADKGQGSFITELTNPLAGAFGDQVQSLF